MLLVGLLGLIVVIAIVCAYFAFTSQKEEFKDAIKIKEEYQSFNDKVNESNKKEYPIVNLNDDNPFVYKTEEEIVQILENGTGIIYFGFPSCPWCRTLLPVLEEVANENNIGEIYYLNIYDIRSMFSLDENKKLITEKEGSSDYYKILDLLKNYLDDYILYTEDEKSVPTNEKRLYAPTLVAVQNGKIKYFHEGTVDTQKDGYASLNANEISELKSTLNELVNSINFGVCDEGC